jgi:hypothetical protein
VENAQFGCDRGGCEDKVGWKWHGVVGSGGFYTLTVFSSVYGCGIYISVSVGLGDQKRASFV